MPEMLSLTEAARQLGISTGAVKAMVEEHTMIAIKSDEGLVVPAQAIDDGFPVKHLSGVLHLLHDAGYSIDEAYRWLTTADDTLPGTPLQALAENRATEIKRRAQALAF